MNNDLKRRLEFEEAIIEHASALQNDRNAGHMDRVEEHVTFLMETPFKVGHEPGMFALTRQTLPILQEHFDWVQELQTLGVVPPKNYPYPWWPAILAISQRTSSNKNDVEKINAAIERLSVSPHWHEISVLCYRLIQAQSDYSFIFHLELISVDRRLKLARLLFDGENDHVWPPQWSSLMQLNQRKWWAQTLTVWDFRPTHPMVSCNSNTNLQSLLRNAERDATGQADLIKTLDSLFQCLTNPTERQKMRAVEDADALISILAQARKWETDRSKVLFTNVSLTNRLVGWLGYNVEQGGWATETKVRTDFPTTDDGFVHLEEFFRGTTTLLVLPIYTPGHFTLAAFWWKDIGLRVMNTAFFDSLTGSTVFTTFFQELTKRLGKTWSFTCETPIKPQLSQRAAECSALMLFGMDLLCSQRSEPVPENRVELYQALVSKTTLPDASDKWVVEDILPSASQLGWQVQVMFLEALQRSYSELMMINDVEDNPSLPLLGKWTDAIDYAGKMLRDYLPAKIGPVVDDLSLDRFLEPWENILAKPALIGVTGDKNKEDATLTAYEELRTTFKHHGQEYNTRDFIATSPWGPTSTTMASLAALAILTNDGTNRLASFVTHWFRRRLVFPLWPHASTIVPKRARSFWSALSFYVPLLQPLISANNAEGGTRRAFLNDLLDGLSTSNDRPRLYQVLSNTYTVFLEDKQALSFERFDSENLLGTLWPQWMTSVPDGNKLYDPSLWFPSPLSTGTRSLLQGLASSELVTWDPDTFRKEHANTLHELQDFLAKNNAYFPEGSWERASLFLRLKEPAAINECAAALAAIIPHVATNALEEVLTIWTTGIDVIDAIQQNSNGTYASKILDPRLRALFLPGKEQRFVVPLVASNPLVKWSRRAHQLFTPGNIGDVNQLLTNAVQQSSLFIREQNEVATAAKDIANYTEENDVRALEIRVAALRAQLMAANAGLFADAENDRDEVDSILPDDGEWDAVPEVVEFRLLVTQWADGEANRNGIIPFLNKIVQVLGVQRKQIMGLTTEMETLTPPELIRFLNTIPANDEELSKALQDVDYDAYLRSPLGSVAKRQKLPETFKMRWPRHLELLNEADALYAVERDRLSSLINQAEKSIASSEADIRHKACQLVSKDYKAYLGAEKATIAPEVLAWFATSANVNDVMETRMLFPSRVEYPAITWHQLSDWINTLADRVNESKLDNALLKNPIFSWFNGRLSNLLVSIRHAVHGRFEDILHEAEYAFDILYSGRIEVSSLSELIGAVVPLNLTFESNGSVWSQDVNNPPLDKFQERFEALALIARLFFDSFARPSEDASSRINKPRLGWQKFYLNFTESGEKKLLTELTSTYFGAIFDRKLLARFYTTTLTGLVTSAGKLSDADFQLALTAAAPTSPHSIALLNEALSSFDAFREYLQRLFQTGLRQVTRIKTEDVADFDQAVIDAYNTVNNGFPLSSVPESLIINRPESSTTISITYRHLTDGNKQLLLDTIANVDGLSASILHQVQALQEGEIHIWHESVLSHLVANPFAATYKTLSGDRGHVFQQLNDIIREFARELKLTGEVPPSAYGNLKGELFHLNLVDGTLLLSYPTLYLVPNIRPETVLAYYDKANAEIVGPLRGFLANTSVQAPYDLDGFRALIGPMHVELTQWASEMQHVSERFPFLFDTSPVEESLFFKHWQTAMDWTNASNLDRAVLGLEILRLAKSPTPEQKLKRILDYMASPQTVQDLFLRNASDFGHSYLDDGDRDRVLTALNNSLTIVNTEITDYADALQRAIRHLTTLTKECQVTIPSVGVKLFRPLLPAEIANVPAIAGFDPDPVQVRYAKVANALAPLLPTKWPQQINEIKSKSKTAEKEHRLYNNDRQHFLNQLVTLLPTLPPLELPELNNRLAQAIALSKEIIQEVSKMPSLALDTLAYNDAQLKRLERRVELFTVHLQHTYGNKSFQLNDAPSHVQAIAWFNELQAALQHALSLITRLKSDIATLQLRNGISSSSLSRRGTIDVADFNYRPEYEDKGDDTRPPWLLCDLPIPGAEKTIAMFGGRIPTPRDLYRATNTYNPSYRAALRENHEAYREFMDWTQMERFAARRENSVKHDAGQQRYIH